MNKKGFLIEIIVIVIFLILGFFWFVSESNGRDEVKKVESIINTYIEDDCVPATCCHADSCVPKNEAPDCEYALCTSQCEPGSMDCGVGHCEMVNKKCGVVWDE